MTDAALTPGATSGPRARFDSEAWVMRGGIAIAGIFLIVAVILPLYAMLSKSFEDKDGAFVGLTNYATYFDTPSLSYSISNSLTVSIVATVIVISLAFAYAYAITRTCMPFKGFFRLVALVPILAPSLLPGISFIYMFGKKGFMRDLLLGEPIYGFIGIVLGSSFWTFPHALLIMITALSLSDARLYEAAEALRASRLRTFFTVTLPGAKYGVISAIFVVFTLVITDFGVPKVIGGQYSVLATDIYKQVIGQQNFQMGAVVSVMLLIPAVLAFGVDRLVQRRQVALLSARAVPYEPKPARGRDIGALVFCTVMAGMLLLVLGVAAYASLVKFWPYNLELGLTHYNFEIMDGGGWGAWFNSMKLAALTALIGTTMIFTVAYLVEKGQGARFGRVVIQAMAMVPLAVPGMVLGLAYIFFFNNPSNPLNGIYATLAILVLSTVAHFYTVAHLTAVTALKQIDGEFESVSSSLKVPFWITFRRVTVPVCQPALFSMAVYLFMNAMTTVSAVVFLYSPDTNLASVAVMNMDDAGDIAPAAAMAMMIVYTNLTVVLIYGVVSRVVEKRTQAWRRR
ncbi:putative 2-aminoethylphosphonate ABC transporter permease subunit [Pelagibius sp. Alg239-R121]|uniref:putative 2-aminoethylphosphonate ABC transporter permease subunit n=1 Tax=Pelagibius sp. Alg239-R121 TaxID=2993448 RepID=UPI0024A6953D|nr:putative 2-aminoethylphosphonate ABC transporter permease subunit [Pelagibius sp. Alg239-R121]